MDRKKREARIQKLQASSNNLTNKLDELRARLRKDSSELRDLKKSEDAENWQLLLDGKMSDLDHELLMAIFRNLQKHFEAKQQQPFETD
ncbi:hypothetical protein [Pelagicoccus mobilis]|uniref:Uncharacterized protein n=1 Tax=Pelagicoccus mobilis TaxID=415221 RepID=A0A934VUC3_9BACT|nr:hypothetical protein [Pelagicoccus mobilis]MBK1880598.1 hypothetical protein [Pelagicoccus mobilis]